MLQNSIWTKQVLPSEVREQRKEIIIFKTRRLARVWAFSVARAELGTDRAACLVFRPSGARRDHRAATLTSDHGVIAGVPAGGAEMGRGSSFTLHASCHLPLGLTFRCTKDAARGPRGNVAV